MEGRTQHNSCGEQSSLNIYHTQQKAWQYCSHAYFVSRFSQTFSLALHSTTEFFVFQQSFYWTRRFEFPGQNVVFNKTIAGRRRTLLLNVKPARMSVKNFQSLFHFKKFQSHFSRQYRDWRHSQHLQSLVVFNRISRAIIVTSDTRNISKRWSTSKNVNRFSRLNTVTSDTRNISQAWSFYTAFLAPISWLAALATSPNVGRLQKISIAFLASIPWLATLATFPKLGRFQSHFSRQYRD